MNDVIITINKCQFAKFIFLNIFYFPKTNYFAVSTIHNIGLNTTALLTVFAIICDMKFSVNVWEMLEHKTGSVVTPSGLHG